MYLDSNRYNVLSALIMHEINLRYISIPHIYKCFFSDYYHYIIYPIIYYLFVIWQIAVFEIQIQPT